MMDLVHIWCDDKFSSKDLFSIYPTHTCGLKGKVIDLEIYIKNLC